MYTEPSQSKIQSGLGFYMFHCIFGLSPELSPVTCHHSQINLILCKTQEASKIILCISSYFSRQKVFLTPINNRPTPRRVKGNTSPKCPPQISLHLPVPKSRFSSLDSIENPLCFNEEHKQKTNLRRSLRCVRCDGSQFFFGSVLNSQRRRRKVDKNYQPRELA